MSSPTSGVPKLTALNELEAIYATVPVGLCVLDTTLRYVRINNRLAEINGISVADHLGKTVREIVPDLADEVETLLHEILATGEPVLDIELTGETRAQPGVKRTWLVQWLPLKNEQDQVIGINIVAEEITEQVNNRRALEEKRVELEKANQELLQVVQEHYRLTALLNNSSDFIGLATPRGQALYINPAGRQLVGIASSTPVAELKITDFFFAKDVSMVQDTILPTVLEQGRWSGEFRFRHFDTGQAIPIFYTLFTVNDPDTGELLGLATITLDITERQQREAELQSFREQLALTNQELAAANEELRAANEDLYQTNDHLKRVNTDLDNFVYTASHDLKAPISNMKGLLSLLAQSLSLESKESPRTQNVLQMMDKSVARFMNTIAELSEIARLEKQSNQPAEPIDLAAVIQEVLEDIAPAVEEANAQVLIDVAQCSTIRFSPKNLRSVVYNLLSNAVKYCDPLRPPVVRVSCQAAEGYQIFTVADNGLGMNLTEDTKLFGMFQRLHDHVEGTGVGLYIVKKIIENAGGKIEVTSQVGQGTTFQVFFSVQN